MINIRADLKNNLLLLELSGHLTDHELRHSADFCIAEAKKLRRGYTIINDVSNMRPVSLAGEKEIIRVQSFVVNHGVGKIIRVVKKDEIREQFQSTENKAGYTAIQARSLKEAYEIAAL